jgi:hypothetical protein
MASATLACPKRELEEDDRFFRKPARPITNTKPCRNGINGRLLAWSRRSDTVGIFGERPPPIAALLPEEWADQEHFLAFDRAPAEGFEHDSGESHQPWSLIAPRERTKS